MKGKAIKEQYKNYRTKIIYENMFLYACLKFCKVYIVVEILLCKALSVIYKLYPLNNYKNYKESNYEH